MTKLKSLKLRYYGLITLVLILGGGVAWRVNAYQSESAAQNVAEAGGTIVVNNTYEAQQAPDEDPFLDQNLGAVTGPHLPNPSCQNNLCTWTIVQDYVDATTTVVSFPMPFQKTTSTGAGAEVVLRYDAPGTDGQIAWTGATSSVLLARLETTGAARTTWSTTCGASAASTTAPSIVLLKSGEMPTSSLGFIENNVTLLNGAAVDGGTTSTIMMGSQFPWFVCKLVAFDPALGISNSTNTFTGRGVFQFSKYIR
jgi:hypothetical protein